MKIIHQKDLQKFPTQERCFIEEIFNVESFPNVSIAKAIVSPDTTTQLHALKGTHEWYYILEGEGKMFVNGKTEIVSTGSTVYIPADDSQQIKNTGSQDLVFLCICNQRFEQENYLDLEKD